MKRMVGNGRQRIADYLTGLSALERLLAIVIAALIGIGLWFVGDGLAIKVNAARHGATPTIGGPEIYVVGDRRPTSHFMAGDVPPKRRPDPARPDRG